MRRVRQRHAWTAFADSTRGKLDAYDETQIVKFVRAHYGTAGEAPEPNAQ